MNNPLLNIESIPDFSAIQPAHVTSALDEVLSQNQRELNELLQQSTFTWDNFIVPLEEMQDRLDKMWGPILHLNAVKQTSELRDVYDANLSKLSGYYTDLAQNEALYRGYLQLKAHPNFATLSRAQQKVIEDALRDFDLSGIALPVAQKRRYKEIMGELSQLQSQFQNHVADASALWKKAVSRPEALSGLTASGMALLRQNAKHKQQDGYLLTLDLPSYLAVLNYAHDRTLRQEIYHAYATRASDCGPFAGQFDNYPVMQKLLKLRAELAQILGFAHYADYSLATKMAESVEEVEQFLLDLAHRAKPTAEQELAALQNLAKADGVSQIEAWDVGYYTEKLRQERYALSPESLRPYFPVNQVLAGIFTLCEKIFAIKIKELPQETTWHPEVTCYAIQNAAGTCGKFYLDLFSREQKRSGAWMDGSISRRRIDNHLRHPVAYLICNFAPAVEDEPALLTHSDLLTLLHELGHGLHHLITQIDYPAIAGTRGVEWDAVELPSQFMENWAWQLETLKYLSAHHLTGESLPDELFQKLEKTRHFNSGINLLRQLEFALFDLHLHRQPLTEGEIPIQTLITTLRREIAVIHPPEWNRFANTFGHIFTGGYAAGYYSYKWAEVLSSDAFGAFEEEGLMNVETGKRFCKEILEMGGVRPAAESFAAFRGRAPKIDALLRHSGI